MFYLQSYIYLLFWSYLFLHLRNSHLVMEKKKLCLYMFVFHLKNLTITILSHFTFTFIW